MPIKLPIESPVWESSIKPVLEEKLLALLTGLIYNHDHKPQVGLYCGLPIVGVAFLLSLRSILHYLLFSQNATWPPVLSCSYLSSISPRKSQKINSRYTQHPISNYSPLFSYTILDLFNKDQWFHLFTKSSLLSSAQGHNSRNHSFSHCYNLFSLFIAHFKIFHKNMSFYTITISTCCTTLKTKLLTISMSSSFNFFSTH